jgi:site-specific DNA-methyltransferase (adenine-specific)
LPGVARIYCADALDVIERFRGRESGVALLLTDPPYGVNLNHKNKSRGRSALAAASDYPAVIGDDQPFDPTPLLAFQRVLMFGANYYANRLPHSPSWFAWDKLDGLTSKREIGFNDSADIELAWSNLGGPARILRHRWMGAMKGSERGDKRVHPTQKPIALMEQIIGAYTKPGDLILDPYMGAGSTLIAARNLGRRAIGVELSPEYCEIAKRRLLAPVDTANRNTEEVA